MPRHLTTDDLINVANASHTHSIGEVSGLQGALDAKQATLVSGTNIATINGQNLLQGGDIAISGGSTYGAANGLTLNGSNFELGGTLDKATTITAGSNTISFFGQKNYMSPYMDMYLYKTYLDFDGSQVKFRMDDMAGNIASFGLAPENSSFMGPHVYMNGGGSAKIEVTNQANVITGTTKIVALAGSGSRMVVADANGNLSTQAIPSGGGADTNFAINNLTATGNRTHDFNNYSMTLNNMSKLDLHVKYGTSNSHLITNESAWAMQIRGENNAVVLNEFVLSPSIVKITSLANSLPGLRSIVGSDIVGFVMKHDTYISDNGEFMIGTTVNSGQKLQVNGSARISGLSGTGTRMVVADADGALSTQVIPTGGTGGATNTSDLFRKATTGTFMSMSAMTTGGFSSAGTWYYVGTNASNITTIGTVVNNALRTTDTPYNNALYRSMKMATATTAGQSVGVNHSNMAVRHAYTPFVFTTRFGIAAPQVGWYGGVGVGATSPGTILPSGLNAVVVGWDPGDSNLKVWANATLQADLGADFPTNSGSGSVYDVTITKTTTLNEWQYEVKNVLNGAVATGTFIKSVSATVSPLAYCNNNTTAAVAQIDVVHLSVELT